MASHPLPYEPYPTVNPSGAPPGDLEQIHATPEMFGARIGAAEEKLGAGFEKAGEAGVQAVVQRQEEQDNIHSASVNTWAANRYTDIYSKFSENKGRAAKDAMQQYQKDLADVTDQAMAQAPNLYEKSKLAQGLRYLQDSYVRYGTNHADSQFNAYATKTANDAASSYGAQAGIAYQQGNWAGFERMLHNQDNEVRNYFEAQHYDRQTIEVEVTKQRSVTLKNIIETQADTDPNAASLSFDRFRKQIDPATGLSMIDPPTQLAIFNKLKPQLQQQGYDIAGFAILGRIPPQEAFSHGERSAGLPIGYTGRVIQLESGGDPNARSPSGTYRGLGQFGPKEMAKYGIIDPGDPIQVSNALLSEAQENTPLLSRVTGHAPTGSELYLAHLEGGGGAAALLANPNRPAWEAMFSTKEGQQKGEGWAKQAIWGNMTASMKAQFPDGVTSVRAGDFVALREGRYMRAGTEVGIIDKAAAYKRLDEAYGGNPVMWKGVKGVIDREYNFQQTATAQRRGELEATVPGIIADQRDGAVDKPLPPDIALLGPVRTALIQAESESALREGQARRTMVWASPEEINGLYTSLATGPGADEFRRRDLQAFSKAIDERDKLIFGSKNPDDPNFKRGDPGGYVQAFPGVAQLKQKLDPKNPATFDAYANASLALQDHLGVSEANRHVLSRAEATQLTTALTTQGADAKGMLDEMARRYGNHYQDVFRDMVTMGKLNPSYQLLGSLDPLNASALGRWLQGMGPNEKGEATTANKILGEAAGHPVAQAIRTRVLTNSALADMQASWEGQGFSPKQIEGLTGAVEDLAYAKRLYHHLNPDDAADEAVTAVAGKYTITPGWGTVAVPVEYYDTMRRNGAKVVDDLKEGKGPDDIVTAQAVGEDRQIGGATGADYLRLLKATPYWVTSEDGKGMVLKDTYVAGTGAQGRIVMRNNGQRVYIPFNSPLMEGAEGAAARAIAPGQLSAVPSGF